MMLVTCLTLGLEDTNLERLSTSTKTTLEMKRGLTMLRAELNGT